MVIYICKETLFNSLIVIPAKAGVYIINAMDAGLRRHDGSTPGWRAFFRICFFRMKPCHEQGVAYRQYHGSDKQADNS
jgi:hypothetical protein